MSQPIRVMQIIARMNVGGPAVIVADLMRGLKKDRIRAKACDWILRR